jgi:hypothetical protein
MIFNIKLSDHAKRDLCDIYEYILIPLLEPGTTKNIIRRILNAFLAHIEIRVGFRFIRNNSGKIDDFTNKFTCRCFFRLRCCYDCYITV